MGGTCNVACGPDSCFELEADGRLGYLCISVARARQADQHEGKVLIALCPTVGSVIRRGKVVRRTYALSFDAQIP
jgi:hypothetical protein